MSTPPCTLQTRRNAIHELRQGGFDVLVLGGGINGAGVLRDLALRNQTLGARKRFGLVEKYQFGSGTSGRNSHLIHGGLRYLKYFDFQLVREALHERSVLLQIAPHLVEPLSLLIPFRSAWDRIFYSTGLLIYDKLAGQMGIGKHRHVPRSQLDSVEPALRAEAFQSAAIFKDCRMLAARLVLENVWDAIGNGAIAANHAEVLDFRRSGGVWQVWLRDRISGEEFATKAQTLIHATGAWTDDTRVRLVRGSHLILPRVNQSNHAISYFEPSGRIVFFVPWGSNDEFTLIGTTEVDHIGTADDVRASDEEIRYLMNVASQVLRNESIREPISSFSSLRPLVRDPSRSATATSREHRIWLKEGVVHITGGKYTTYRLMSEEAADLAWPDSKSAHRTSTTPLNGNSPEELSKLLSSAPEIGAEYGLPSREIAYLTKAYGVHIRNLLSLYSDDVPTAVIAYAAHHEMAQRLVDVLCVSTTWGYEHRWTYESLHPLAEALGSHLGWNSERIQAETEEILSMVSFPLPMDPGEQKGHPTHS